jgi:hypothetical protein
VTVKVYPNFVSFVSIETKFDNGVIVLIPIILSVANKEVTLLLAAPCITMLSRAKYQSSRLAPATALIFCLRKTVS